jgi:hypothetical protein
MAGDGTEISPSGSDDDEDAAIAGLPPASELEMRSGAAFDRIVGNVANTGVSVWLTSSTGSPEAASTIGGMVGPLAEEISFAVRRALGIKAARGQRMIEAVAVRTGTDTQDLLAELLSDPLKMELLLQALEAAGRSTTEAKLDLIAELLATGALAEDTPVVQEQLLALEAVKTLDTPHFRLLLILGRPSGEWWGDPTLLARFKYSWLEARIIDKDPGLKNGLGALLAKLDSLGMVRRSDGSPGLARRWEKTDFGDLCIEAIKRRSSDPEGWP